jgi:cbb3-type cytochrome oxidase subunit 1
VIGIVLFALPLAIAGVRQGIKMQALEDFTVLTKSTLPFVRTSMVGVLLIFVGHLLLLANLVRLSIRYYRMHFAPLYAEVTAELKPAEVKP